MNGWIDLFYFFIGGAALLLSVLGLWFTAIMPGINRWSKNFFLSYFAVLMLSCFFGIIEMVMYAYYHPVPIASIYLVLLIESIFLSLPMPMLTVYLLHCCGERMRSSKVFHAVLCLLAAHFVMLASIMFSDSIIYFTPDGQYHPGALYPLFLLPLLAIMLLNLACAIRYRARLSRKTFLSFIIAILPMTVTLPLQMFFDVYALIDISFVISALSMYSLILSDQIEQDLSRQREIANQRASIMVLQMRPHFIYNTMTSIYCLCGQNPQLARKVIMDFTTYLRKNFTAIASASPIPFSAELEHTKAYLAVEQAQYEDSLFVDYDTPHIWFRVPPLTLQPIVENAIKHGRDPYADPLRISIRTRKTASGSEIVVEDNGRGFDPDDESEPHIALANIKQRLRVMCRGEMMVIQSKEGGTVIKVIVPRWDL
ncbi:MAG: histidine kinase [Synergistaceae bacterium]|nr:histidine kinase [Synergistaceae bacterium]